MRHRQDYIREKDEKLVLHQGVYRRQISYWQAVTFMSAIGAGILGIPYVIAKVGLLIGIPYIIFVGLLMIGVNLLVGDIAVRTGYPLQLIGLARKYLGRIGAVIMGMVVYSVLFGALTVYIIGVGESLSAMFGGPSFWWSILFFSIASFFVYIGLHTIKKVEMVLIFLTLFVILLIAALSIPGARAIHWVTFDLKQLLLPYGVLLFAFHGTTSIPEAYSLIRHREKDFHRAIVFAGSIGIIIYAFFAAIVVQVTGPATTEIATIGLGRALGPGMMILGNLFAVFAMSMGFLVVGVSLRDSFRWDLKIPSWMASFIACGAPLTLFLYGLRSFIGTIDLVGGIFATTEMALILLIYWRARRVGKPADRRFGLHHALPLVSVILLALSAGAVYSVLKLF